MAKSRTNEKAAANPKIKEEAVVKSDNFEEAACEDDQDNPGKVIGGFTVDKRTENNELAGTITITQDADKLLRQSLNNRRTVSLDRTATFETDDLAFWVIIQVHGYGVVGQTAPDIFKKYRA
jgi:hypothetical protein